MFGADSLSAFFVLCKRRKRKLARAKLIRKQKALNKELLDYSCASRKVKALETERLCGDGCEFGKSKTAKSMVIRFKFSTLSIEPATSRRLRRQRE